MKKILLLSDTHSHIDESILKYVHTVDEVWHAGDIGSLAVTEAIAKLKPLKAVHGNIDNINIRQQFTEELIFTTNGIKVYITHIGGYPKKYSLHIKQKLKAIHPDVFICGHSHILKVIYDKELNLLHLNPGAAGIYGLHVVRTMLRFTIENATIKNLEIIEIPKDKKKFGSLNRI